MSVLAGVAAVTVTTGPAAAAPACNSQTVSNVDDRQMWVKNGTVMRKAPYNHCGSNATVGVENQLWVWCATKNSYGNTWYWVRWGSIYGWVYEGNINNMYPQGQSTKWCPGEPSI